MKPSERIQIDFIVGCLLADPQPDKKTITANFRKKWQDFPLRTFESRYGSAKKEWEKIQARISAQVNIHIEKEIELRKSKILTVIEKQEILTSIARGELVLAKPMIVDKKVESINCVADYMDRKNCISELNRMGGDYAPTKLQHTVTKLGADLEDEIYEDSKKTK